MRAAILVMFLGAVPVASFLAGAPLQLANGCSPHSSGFLPPARIVHPSFALAPAPLRRADGRLEAEYGTKAYWDNMYQGNGEVLSVSSAVAPYSLHRRQCHDEQFCPLVTTKQQHPVHFLPEESVNNEIMHWNALCSNHAPT